MSELQKEFKLTYLFVSHNLGVIRHVSDRVAVLYLGRLVELAENEPLFDNPKHPYTAALLKSIPLADPTIESGLEAAPGEIGNPLNPPERLFVHPPLCLCHRDLQPGDPRAAGLWWRALRSLSSRGCHSPGRHPE